MTREETTQILSILRSAYPAFYRGMTYKDGVKAVDTWAVMFEDDPVELVIAAVKALIATDEKGYPPHIGAVKAKMRMITTPEEMTEAEAWQLVAKATENALYNSQKEFDKLPTTIQRLVGSPNQLRDWAMMDSNTLNSVVASNFQRSYRARMAHEREYAALPESVKAMCANVGGNLAMPADPPILTPAKAYKDISEWSRKDDGNGNQCAGGTDNRTETVTDYRGEAS